MVLGMMLFSISLLSRNAMSTKWNIAFWSKQKLFLTPLKSEAASQCTLPQIRFSGILQFGRKKGFQDHSRLQLLHLVWIHSLKSSYQWQKKKLFTFFETIRIEGKVQWQILNATWKKNILTGLCGLYCSFTNSSLLWLKKYTTSEIAKVWRINAIFK